MNYFRAIHARNDDAQAWANGLQEREGFTAPIPFVASTEGKKADGFDLKSDDWDLARYREYSPILFSHDYWGTRPPIGVGVADIVGDRLLIGVYFDKEDEFAMTMHSKALRGMAAGSVGWDVVDDQNQLLEFSMVPVPLDPKSLPLRQARSLRAVSDQLHNLFEAVESSPLNVDLSKPDEAIWRGISGAMLGVFMAAGSVDEKQRRKLYDHLSRAYDVLDAVAPDWRTADEIAPLQIDEIRGLFFEQEFAIHEAEQARQAADAADDTETGDLEAEIKALKALKSILSGV